MERRLFSIYFAGMILCEVKTMDKQRKKQLLEEYKNRHPEMGVISYYCKATGESFLGISKDTRADFNSIYTRLMEKCHPNVRMQEIWNEYGQDGFEITVIKKLKYDNPHENHTRKLEQLREECLSSIPNSSKIWK